LATIEYGKTQGNVTGMSIREGNCPHDLVSRKIYAIKGDSVVVDMVVSKE